MTYCALCAYRDGKNFEPADYVVNGSAVCLAHVAEFVAPRFVLSVPEVSK